MQQYTLRAPCHIYGMGLHSGQPTQVSLLPAPPDTGVWFRLFSGGRQVEFPATHESVVRTTMSTCLGREGLEVCTVEHLLAALAGLEIDNVVIETEGPEMPAMDGSSQPFVARIMEVGRKVQAAPRRYIKVLAPIQVEAGDKFAGLFPSVAPTYSFLIDFPNPGIQTQSLKVFLTPQTFVAQLAKARTFGFIEDLQSLQRKGLALGAGLENAVALDPAGAVLNPGGLRYRDEFVRHKILDAIGDLSLAGAPILAEYRGVKSGHQLNHRLLQRMAELTDHWEIVSAGAEAQAV
ncbi:MAG TPA: UDP-3-O-acyl-N-acetylglucosamine deacetylase [bacterium]|nr:UDP-3-O-acyl-N-acetylglucosamine deacetylase [bacterium]